jgi:hypothetical protein
MLDWLKRQRSIDDLIVNGQHKRAIRLLETELAQEPSNERVRRKLGDVLALAGHTEKAIAVLKELADQYARAGFTAKAIALVKRMQRIDPDRAELDDSLAQLIAASTAEQEAVRTPGVPAPSAPPPGPTPTEPQPPDAEVTAPVVEPEEYEARMIDFEAEDEAPVIDFEEVQVGDEVPGIERYAPGGPPPERSSSVEADGPTESDAPEFEPVDLSGDTAPASAAIEDVFDPPAKPADGPDERVAASPLFTGLQTQELTAIIRGLRLRPAHPGEIIVTEGEEGNSMFLIASGSVRVYVKDSSEHNVQVRRLGAGDFFGEISLLQGEPRTATITAADSCELLELGREDLTELATNSPEAASVIEHFCQQRAGSEEETAARSDTTT